MNRIPGILRVGAGGGTVAGASAGVLAQPVRKQPVRRQPVRRQPVHRQLVRRHQAEVVVPK